MEQFVGLDVSVREASLCVVDYAGKIVKEARVPTEPEAIVALLGNGNFTPKRVTASAACRALRSIKVRQIRLLERGSAQQPRLLGGRDAHGKAVTFDGDPGNDETSCTFSRHTGIRWPVKFSMLSKRMMGCARRPRGFDDLSLGTERLDAYSGMHRKQKPPGSAADWTSGNDVYS